MDQEAAAEKTKRHSELNKNKKYHILKMAGHSDINAEEEISTLKYFS